MELDRKNIGRLAKVWVHTLNKNKFRLIKSFVGYTYLYATYIMILAYCISNMPITVRPLGYFFVIRNIVCFYLGYVAINHLIVRYFLPWRRLITFDILLLASILLLIFLD